MLNQLEDWIINTLQAVFDQFGWLGVSGLMLFENATGITPSEVILGMAGWFLVSRHSLPISFIFIGSLYATTGSVLGASITYWVARIGGRPIVDQIARWCRVPIQHIHRSEELFHRWGPGLVLIGRIVPGIRTLISIPAGLARMPYPLFVLTTTIGAYVWCTLLIGIGFWLGEEWEQIGGLVQQYTLPLAAVAAFCVALLWWFRQVKKQRLIAYFRKFQWTKGNE